MESKKNVTFYNSPSYQDHSTGHTTPAISSRITQKHTEKNEKDLEVLNSRKCVTVSENTPNSMNQSVEKFSEEASSLYQDEELDSEDSSGFLIISLP